MSTIEKSEGRWAEIYQHFGLMPSTQHWIKECPFCGKKKSFRISPDKIQYGGSICTCGEYNGIQTLMQITSRDFKSLCDEIDGIIGNQYQQSSEPSQRESQIVKYNRYRRTLKKVKGTGVELYLNNRGIYKMPKLAMGAGVETVNGIKCDVMVCLATTNSGFPCYLHRTYIINGQKAVFKENSKGWIAPTKKLTRIVETTESTAIRFHYHDQELGVAEGVETAKMAELKYGVRTWSLLNTSIMKRFVCPDGVKRLVIFADTDKKGAGHAAAFACAHKNLIANNDITSVIVRWREKLGDFADTEYSRLMEWTFNK